MKSKLATSFLMIFSSLSALACPEGQNGRGAYCVASKNYIIEFDGISHHFGNWATMDDLFNNGQRLGDLECPSRTPFEVFPHIDLVRNTDFPREALRIRFVDGSSQCEAFEQMVIRASLHPNRKVVLSTRAYYYYHRNGNFKQYDAVVFSASEFDENGNVVNSF